LPCIRAAAGVGTVEETLLRKTSDTCVAENKSALEIFTYPDKPSGLRLVQNNRADLMLTDGGFVGAQAKTQPGVFAQAFSIKTDFKVGPGVAKTMPQLRDALADVLRTLESDGTMQGLMAKYGIDSTLMLPVESFTQ
jgi:polar amino acid transport system substrate-binding protein